MHIIDISSPNSLYLNSRRGVQVLALGTLQTRRTSYLAR